MNYRERVVTINSARFKLQQYVSSPRVSFMTNVMTEKVPLVQCQQSHTDFSTAQLLILFEECFTEISVFFNARYP